MQAPFRPATTADEPTLLELMREFYQEERMPFEEGGGASGAARRARRSLAWARAADRGGRRASPAISWSASAGASSSSAATPSSTSSTCASRFRGQGLGTRALEVAAEVCRASGVRALHLEVEQSNTRAQSIYRKTGFADREHYLMTRRLGSAARVPGARRKP